MGVYRDYSDCMEVMLDQGSEYTVVSGGDLSEWP